MENRLTRSSSKKVAIVHYWWLVNRGGEAVVAELLKLFPNADLYTHVCDKNLIEATVGKFHEGAIFTTFISRLPFSRRLYQKYLPLMPFALEQIDLSDYDIIISSESGPAKGVITRPDALHICYCHTPMRYLWDMYHQYINKSSWAIKILFPLMAHRMRIWDIVSSSRVDYFIANSSFIKARIKKFYRRESLVIYPPVNVHAFSPSKAREDFYLYLGQLVPYKRADLAIDAFNKLGKPLIVIGEGEELDRLKKVGYSNIKFMGRQSSKVVREHLEKCKALIFPGKEDFGIVPVEAMAAGAPVIAYGEGGALDTIIDGLTGILFFDASAASLIKAIEEFELKLDQFDSNFLHKHAMQFDREIFQYKIISFIEKCLSSDVGT